MIEDTPSDPRFTYDDFCRWACNAAPDDEVVLRIEPTSIRLTEHAAAGAGLARESIGMQRAMSISVASSTGSMSVNGGVYMRADGLVVGVYRPVASASAPLQS